jgi:hypothetical protein
VQRLARYAVPPVCTGMLLVAPVLAANESTDLQADLMEMDLEALMDPETSISKKPRKQFSPKLLSLATIVKDTDTGKAR